jgi:hypothetical protein
MASPFAQQVIATLIGTFAGFFFSLVLFYLTELWKKKQLNKDISANIQRELQYNIDHLESYKGEFEKMLRQITANGKEIWTIFKHNKLQRLFLLDAFQKGLLYRYLTTDEINQMDAMLNYFQPYRDQILTDLLNSFRTDQKTGQEVLATMEWDRDQIEKHIKTLKTLKTKLKDLK